MIRSTSAVVGLAFGLWIIVAQATQAQEVFVFSQTTLVSGQVIGECGSEMLDGTDFYYDGVQADCTMIMAGNSAGQWSCGGAGTVTADCPSPSSFAATTGATYATSGSHDLILTFDGARFEDPLGFSLNSTLACGSSCTVVPPGSPFAFADTALLLLATTSAAITVGPSGVLSPNSLTFGSQLVGTTSGAQTVTLSNNGTASLSISMIATTGDFTQTNNCGSTLPAGVSCSISVIFSPTASGPSTGSLIVTDNAPGSHQTATLNGTGTAPMADLSPTSLTFGSQLVGTTSAAKSIMLSNNGTASLSISMIATTGDFAQTNNCGSTLPAGVSCSISVTFSPTASGARTGSLIVTDNAPGSHQTATLNGTGTAPTADLSPTSLTFASQLVGTISAAKSIMLSNNGTASLSINMIATTGDFAQINNCGSTLPAGVSCSISITFTPTAGGTRTGSLQVSDNAPGSPQTASLNGAGIGSIAPSVSSISPTAGPVGTTVTISGANFGATQGSGNVTFNGTAAQALTWNATSITASAPMGATSGNVVVRTNDGSTSNGVPYAVQEDALHLFAVNCSSCGQQITDVTIQGSPLYGYLIQPGDVLTFYQKQSPGSIGGMTLCFANGDLPCDDDGSTVDQNGRRISADVVQGVSHFRIVSLTPSAGLTLAQITFDSTSATSAGRWDMEFSDVQIRSQDGTIHPIFMTGSSPSLYFFSSTGVKQRGYTIDHSFVW
jgi:hypothetical protein